MHTGNFIKNNLIKFENILFEIFHYENFKNITFHKNESILLQTTAVY